MKVLPKGHCFIDLVDPTNAQDSGAPTLNVKCWSTRWRSVRTTLDSLGITLDAGMVVRARGKVEFYKARGSVDFILSELDTDALLGKVAAERARLIKALVDEGLFDRQRRLQVAALPLRVGLVASPDTEGYNDFLGGLRSSGMAFEVTVAPTAVQGKVAPARVAAAISNLQAEPLDVIVVVRGGGSKADLAAFDQERVARAIATSVVPVWTGIGHTGDQSVADEVANRSFITPTECGQELALLVIDYWRRVEDAGAAVARMARDQVLAADRLLASRQRAAAIGARAQLDRHGDGLGHRARTLRGVSRGQLDTHALRLSARGEALIVAALPRAAGRGRSPRRPVHPAGRAARTPASGRGSAPGPVAQTARRLRLPAPAGAGVFGDTRCVGTGGPIGSRCGHRGAPADEGQRRRAGLDGRGDRHLGPGTPKFDSNHPP